MRPRSADSAVMSCRRWLTAGSPPNRPSPPTALALARRRIASYGLLTAPLRRDSVREMLGQILDCQGRLASRARNPGWVRRAGPARTAAALLLVSREGAKGEG